MRRLSLTVHGESGAGKSWIGDSAPAPRLILDAEGGSYFTPSQPKVLWDPRTGPPPTGAETVIVLVRDFSVMQLAWQWLNSGQHDFNSVVLDSITELQKRCKDTIKGSSGMLIQDWGTLLDEMEDIVRNIRDLWQHPARPVPVCVILAGTQMEDGSFRPDVQGGLKRSMPYFTDVVGYLHTRPNAAGETDHVLLVKNLPGFIAKDRTDRLGTEVVDPKIVNMLTTIYGEETV